MGMLAPQADVVGRLVDLEHERPRAALAVVEQRDRVVGLATRVMLPGERRVGVDREVAALASEPPDDLRGPAVDLVDRVGVAGGDEQVLVVVDGDRVQVHVVPVAADRPVGLADRDVVPAVPLHQHGSRAEVDLLEDRVLDRGVARAADVAQVIGGDLVGRQECGAAVGEEELVQVALAAVAGVEVGDRA